MDKGERVRLIREIRRSLEADYDWQDRELTLTEFGFDSMQGDNFGNGPSLTEILQNGANEDLIALASHLSLDLNESGQRVAQATTSPVRPLLLFASHASAHRRLVGGVARQLLAYGVTLFVAHVSIQPDKEWRDEIAKTLDEADAGVAFLHREFSSSEWCDQETGWLLGRRVPVVSLKFDIPPYGPLGERQALDASTLTAREIADALLDILETRPELHRGLAASWVKGMRQSASFQMTDRIWKRLRNLRNLAPEQCEVLIDALDRNNQVYWADSPLDGGRPYAKVIPAFIRLQPGAAAVDVRLREVEAELSS